MSCIYLVLREIELIMEKSKGMLKTDLCGDHGNRNEAYTICFP